MDKRSGMIMALVVIALTLTTIGNSITHEFTKNTILVTAAIVAFLAVMIVWKDIKQTFNL